MLIRVGLLAFGSLLLSANAFAQTSDAANCAKGEGDSAIAACSEIIAAGDGAEVSWALFDRARAYFNEKMYGSAVDDLTEVLRFRPDDTQALENRGLAFLSMDDYGRAIADFGKVIDLQPTSVAAWRERCWTHAAAGRDLDDALEDCNKALSLKANDAAALDARCFMQLRLSAYAAAITDCSAAAVADPQLASSRYLRGVAKNKMGDVAGGDADIDAARARDPDIAQTFANYGVKP
ncbi:MAG TPA: tetratricopeptide repeat protein [Rhizomicrobium sp.]|jgi:tetratricopeptide (TPR) repeat protein|nr:tetratricopeptide repeat protein [Rhizomicrobium sp.]